MAWRFGVLLVGVRVCFGLLGETERCLHLVEDQGAFGDGGAMIVWLWRRWL